MSVGVRVEEDLGDRRIAGRTLQGPLKNRIRKKGGDSLIVQRPAQGSLRVCSVSQLECCLPSLLLKSELE